MIYKEKLKVVVFTVITIFFIVLFAFCIDVSDKKKAKSFDDNIPRIGQKMWVYNINNHDWFEYNKSDEDKKQEVIILQLQNDPEMPDVTSYYIDTKNIQVTTAPFFLSEGSKEFIISKNLYTFYPRSFEFSQVLFNGFNFTLNMLKPKDVLKLFKGYQVIKISDFDNYKLELKYSKKHNKYIILNDIGDKFYMYYVVPNSNDKLQIGKFANQFIVKDVVDIRLQRLEGCTKAYPCYEIKMVK